MKYKKLLLLFVFSTFFLFFFSSSTSYNGNLTTFNDQESKNTQPEIVPGVVVIKLKSNISTNTLSKASGSFGISSLDSKLQKYGVLNVAKMFKHKPIPANSNIPDISRIVKVQILEDVNPLLVIQDLKNDPNIEYAEPIYKRYPNIIPNDPKYSQQNYLPQINVHEAWDYKRGDSNVVIAIIDSDFDLEHEDLKANVWINTIERDGLEGIDDDGNGFIDDINGWDFGYNDNDPSIDVGSGNSHGTHVAGIACAVTDNNIGISGLSWNCKFMPIKISKNEVFFDEKGFSGIIYAAENGADIINNSWGGSGFLEWEQDIIKYAHSRGSIVVCGAGNTNTEYPFYPSAYQKSVSVASVNIGDEKSYFSTFGSAIDICAPGNVIMSTLPENQYGLNSGTSMACPVVAGVFGLVKSKHPNWSNEQIIKQVLLSSEDIYSINTEFRDKLGHGRVNALNALTLSNLPVLDARFSVSSFEFNDSLYGDNDMIFENGESVTLKTTIRNYSIGETENASFFLTSLDPKVEVLSGNVSNVYFPADTTMEIEFEIGISDDFALNEVHLNLDMQTTMGFERNETISLFIGTTPILLIDHDNGWAYPVTQIESYYKNILDQQNVSYTYWNCIKSTFPNAKTLKNYPIVLLFKEVASGYSKFKLSEQSEIKKYLDNGGNLFISGPNIGFELWENTDALESKEFMKNYLHAEYIEDHSNNYLAKGIENDPISNSISFKLHQPYLEGSFNSFDVIEPMDNAHPIFLYGNDKTGAIKFLGNHRVVYLGFGLESVDSDMNTQLGDMSPIRTKVLMRSLNWLNFIEHEPLKDTNDYLVARRVTAKVRPISPEVKSMKIKWRSNGEEVFNSVIMQKSNDTLYVGEIPGQSEIDTIEYYIESEFEYYTWTNPINAPEEFFSYKVGDIDTDVDELSKLPTEFSLSQNYPNPFNPTTTIKYSVPRNVKRETINVKMIVYDILGREVTTLINEKQKPGNYEVEWDGLSVAGGQVPSGVYFYQLTADVSSGLSADKAGSATGFVETKKMILMR